MNRDTGRKAVFFLPLICHVCLNWKLIRQWLNQFWGLTVLPICLIWDFLLIELLKQGMSGTASSRAKSHNAEPLNQHWRCLLAVQGEARSCSWAEQELCSFCWYWHDFQGLTGKFAPSTFGHKSWDSRMRDKRKPLKRLNFPSIESRVQRRRRWLLPSLSSHLEKRLIHKSMRLPWGMCIKLHFGQCKEVQTPLTVVGHSSS